MGPVGTIWDEFFRSVLLQPAIISQHQQRLSGKNTGNYHGTFREPSQNNKETTTEHTGLVISVNMMMSVKSGLYLLVLYSTILQTSGLELLSDPMVSAGLVSTELDNTVSLTCVSEGTELEWFRNGQLIRVAEGNTLGTSRVCIWPVTHNDNAAIFTCQQKNDTRFNASAQLEVTYAPMNSVTDEVLVEQTRELVLSCDVFANPQVSVSWERHRAPIDLSDGGFEMTNDGTTSHLKVGKVDRDKHQGLYSCVTASPRYPTPNIKSFQVTVTDKTLQVQLDLVFPIIAGAVVIGLTTLLAIVSRWRRIIKCCKPDAPFDHSQ
ncbi:hypothetical protein DPEC_G00230100 [Dallia pectoralis]|uniref:Uncharacterized protein n=1 Tax=Dallia pectoralis TaxID=75939 RepID=A0ACC2G1S6_DALPE|nr:hypothetical protein DPEC_G00230100 [Dallia pectoralis]